MSDCLIREYPVHRDEVPEHPDWIIVGGHYLTRLVSTYLRVWLMSLYPDHWVYRVDQYHPPYPDAELIYDDVSEWHEVCQETFSVEEDNVIQIRRYWDALRDMIDVRLLEQSL